MRYNGKRIHKNCQRGLNFKMIRFAIILLFFCGTILPVQGFCGKPQLRSEWSNIGITQDTTKVTSDKLPLVQNPGGLSRPRFETVHMVLGIGWMQRNFTDLNQLGIGLSNNIIPLSFYAYIPLNQDNPLFYLLGGFDIGLGDKSDPAFKALLFYQTSYRLIVGLGAGRTAFTYWGDDNNLNIEISQTQPMVALGINLSPRRVDLLLTVPVNSSMTTFFEENEYSVRPAGIQVSLLVSLR